MWSCRSLYIFHKGQYVFQAVLVLKKSMRVGGSASRKPGATSAGRGLRQRIGYSAGSALCKKRRLTFDVTYHHCLCRRTLLRNYRNMLRGCIKWNYRTNPIAELHQTVSETTSNLSFLVKAVNKWVRTGRMTAIIASLFLTQVPNLYFRNMWFQIFAKGYISLWLYFLQICHGIYWKNCDKVRLPLFLRRS